MEINIFMYAKAFVLSFIFQEIIPILEPIVLFPIFL